MRPPIVFGLSPVTQHIQTCGGMLVTIGFLYVRDSQNVFQKLRERPDGGFTVLDGDLRAQIDGDSIIVMIIQVCCWRQNF